MDRDEARCDTHSWRSSNRDKECPACLRAENAIKKKDQALTDLMAAYERIVRSWCLSPDELDKKPWECWEYVAARDALKEP